MIVTQLYKNLQRCAVFTDIKQIYALSDCEDKSYGATIVYFVFLFL